MKYNENNHYFYQHWMKPPQKQQITTLLLWKIKGSGARGGGGVCARVCLSVCQFREWLPSDPRVLSLTSLASSRAPISPFLRVPPTVQPGFCFRSQTPGEASDWVATQEGPSSSRGQWESLWTWSWLGSSRLSILESACALAPLKVWYI